MTILQESNARIELIRCLSKAYARYYRHLLKAKEIGLDGNLIKRIQAEVAENFSMADEQKKA